jgi:hypothetical protein
MPVADAGPRQTDRVSVTIGTNHRSESAIIATTDNEQEADEIRTVPLWPSVATTTRVDSVMVTIDSQQCQNDHRAIDKQQSNGVMMSISTMELELEELTASM